MEDKTEGTRRVLVAAINHLDFKPEGKTWTTEELPEEFEVLGFLAPFVVVRHKASDKKGTLKFKHSPRVYFGWKEF